MEINKDKLRIAAALIALANGGCVVRHSQVNFREETTSWTGSAPAPTYTPGPTSEGYGYAPPPTYYPPPYEYGGPSYEYYGPPAEEWYPPPQEYYPPIE
ncbi:MAG: hypothetical protein HY907_19740 [Deltaproteobacteria bacterium]|nr:hypothetical protein [Deltaproteobacteria bacterium]